MNKAASEPIQETRDPQPLRQRQRDALEQLFVLTAECDQIDGVHQSGYTARQAWIARRFQHAQQHIEQRDDRHRQAISEYEAALQALIADQQATLVAARGAAHEQIERTNERNRNDQARLQQDVENRRTGAAKLMEDNQAYLAT
jgi:hypothetical protein